MTSRRSDPSTDSPAVQLELPLGRATGIRPRRRTGAHRSGSGGRGRPSARPARSGRPTPPTVSEGPSRSAFSRSGAEDGRLDAQTRRIGRQGIAAARARLAAPQDAGVPEQGVRGHAA
jgi:hypothetical protein